MAMGKGQDLSHPNRNWGICGFVSVLASLYESDPKMKAKLNKILDDKHFETRLLADIKTFLVMLQADDNTALLKEIEVFTGTFHKGFKLDAFIKRINGVVNDKELLKDEFTLAMTEKSLLEYLKTNWELKATLTMGAGGAKKNKVILGLYEGKALKHWVYKKSDAETYNWGEKKTLAEVLKECNLAVGCSIELP
jgi:hypothetical protein